MLAEIVRQELHRSFLFEADLGMARDVVAECEQLRVHELLRARGNLIACGVRSGETRDHRGHVQRSLERIHLGDDASRGIAFGGSFLSGQETRRNE